MATPDCNDQQEQSKEKGLHALTEAQFNDAIKSLTKLDPAQIKPYSMNASDISDMINAKGVDCTYYIRVGQPLLHGPIVPVTNNADLKFEVNKVGVADIAVIVAYYTMTLFRGLFNKAISPEPASFDFYKANCLDPKTGAVLHTTVAFRVNMVDVGAPATHWDLSTPPGMIAAVK